MRTSLLALWVALALVSPAYAAEPVSASRIEAMEARIAKLEADAQALRQQSTAAVADAKAARAELAQSKAGQPATAAFPVDADNVAADAGNDDVAAAPDDLAATQDASVAAATPADAGASGGSNALNPAISIILNGSYSHHSLDPDRYTRAGFPLVGEGRPGPQGLSLGESEVSFAANIDDKLYGQLTMSVGNEDGQDHLGIEEAYIDTTSLPAGFSLRAGRFFSNVGYLNSHHAHTDSFFDRPLAYQAFLGNQYGDDGVQLRWVAPTSTFLEFGGELLRGQNSS